MVSRIARGLGMKPVIASEGDPTVLVARRPDQAAPASTSVFRAGKRLE
jgi:hypothetical protein